MKCDNCTEKCPQEESSCEIAKAECMRQMKLLNSKNN